MSTGNVPSNVFFLESIYNSESLDKLLDDEEFFMELIDLINQNFVMEVEASHIHDA